MRTIISAAIPAAAFAMSLLSGCSIHPLQDDVTDLNLYDVAQKIRCEARETVVDLLTTEGLRPLKPGLAAIQSKIDKLKKGEISATSKTAKKLQDDFAKLQAIRDNIILDYKQIFLEGTIFQNAHPGAETPPELKERLKTTVATEMRYDLEVVSYARKANKNKVDTAEGQKLLDGYQKTITEKFKKLNDFYSYQMAYSFRFEITETNSETGNLSYKFPVPLGTISVGLSGGDVRQREGDRNVKLVISFKDLEDLACFGELEQPRFPRHYPITGKIGVAEVIQQYIRLTHQQKGAFAEGGSYTDQIIFTTTLNGAVSPSFTVAPATLQQISGSGIFGPMRKDLHAVLISLAPAGKVSADADKVTTVRLLRDEDLFAIPR